MAKHPTSVCLSEEQKQAIDRERDRLAALGVERPSRGTVIRGLIDRNLSVDANEPRKAG